MTLFELLPSEKHGLNSHLDRAIWPLSTHVDERGRLCVGGVAAAALAAQFGTPTRVVDEEDFGPTRATARRSRARNTRWHWPTGTRRQRPHPSRRSAGTARTRSPAMSTCPPTSTPASCWRSPAPGAYHYSMGSCGNLVGRPPLIAVAGGRSYELVRRETVADLLARDCG